MITSVFNYKNKNRPIQFQSSFSQTSLKLDNLISIRDKIVEFEWSFTILSQFATRLSSLSEVWLKLDWNWIGPFFLSYRFLNCPIVFLFFLVFFFCKSQYFLIVFPNLFHCLSVSPFESCTTCTRPRHTHTIMITTLLMHESQIATLRYVHNAQCAIRNEQIVWPTSYNTQRTIRLNQRCASQWPMAILW